MGIFEKAILFWNGLFYFDEEAIGRACIQKSIMAITTLSGAEAAVRAIRLINQTIQLRSIQEYHH